MAGPTNAPEPKMDANDLYREDIYSDRKVGTIRVLTPVNSDGTPDHARPTSYVGQAQIMTPAGALPLSFEIEAKTLAEACAGFAEGANAEAAARTVGFPLIVRNITAPHLGWRATRRAATART